jgi:23S rRNA (pseudouridine1915-N3)-methyltransferase
MIKLIAVGKIKESYFKDAISEYQKRLSRYTKLEIIEVPDYSTDNNKLLEAKEIKKHLSEKDHIIILDINAKMYDSLSFAEYIRNKEMQYSNIAFIIGGSNGLDDSIKELANDSISFSKLTFPHQLFRVIFLEQLYRAYKINNNESYHK